MRLCLVRALLVASVLCVAFTARAQNPDPLSCRVVAVQATQRLMGSALEGELATADEKRVFGEFQSGVIDECARAADAKCFVYKPGEQKAADPRCPKDPLAEWMATSASQILPTQIRHNRATQALEELISKAPEPAPSAPAVPPPPPTPPPATTGALTPPPPPPPPSPSPPAAAPSQGSATAEDAPVLEGDALLTASLTNRSKRELRGIQTLLEEQKPGFGLSIGMYAGGAGAIALGSLFLASSLGYYVNTFGLVLGAAALTAGVAMIVIGTLALVSRLRTRGRYNLRLEEVRDLLHRPRKSAVRDLAFPLVTVAQW